MFFLQKGCLHFQHFYATEVGYNRVFWQFYHFWPFVHSQTNSTEQNEALLLNHMRIWYRILFVARVNTVSNSSWETLENARAFSNHTDMLLVLSNFSRLFSGLSIDTRSVSYQPSLEPKNVFATDLWKPFQPFLKIPMKPSRSLFLSAGASKLDI